MPIIDVERNVYDIAEGKKHYIYFHINWADVLYIFGLVVKFYPLLFI